jgi:hypothetical protein
LMGSIYTAWNFSIDYKGIHSHCTKFRGKGTA